MFYIAQVSSPLDPATDLFIRHQFDFSGKHYSHAAIMREDKSLTYYVHQVLIYTAE